MIGKIIFALIGVPIGILIIVKTHFIVDEVTGPISFAERLFSSFGSGTYSFFRILGFATIIVSLLVLFGVTDWIYYGIVGSFGELSSPK
jgi:F0F1-type ATP synthase membrane subunit a